MRRLSNHRLRSGLRVALSHYVANGVSVALGLLLISVLVHAWLGPAAAAAASVGVVVCSPPDLPGPRRGKLWQMLPAPLLGIPLFFAVQWLHGDPLHLGLLLVPGTFLAFLAMAWGRRGIPIAVAVMFSMIFSMAAASRVPAGTDPLPAALAITAHFALGAGLYVLYAVAANRLLNARYRVQFVADTLLSLAALMRAQARLFDGAHAGTAAAAATAATASAQDEAHADEEAGTRAAGAEEPHALTGLLLQRQAALAEQLQAARNIVLESPTTPRRQRLAGMLLLVLEMRDHLLACELDVETLKTHPGHVPVLHALRGVLHDVARELAHMADALLRGGRPDPFTDARPALAQLRWSDPLPAQAVGGPSPHALARGLADRVGHINDEALRLNALARGDAPPNLAVVRASWQMFVSPTAWSWAPLATLWRWDAPPLRHAVRAALALAAGFVVAQSLPWGTHAYWILLTIVVVLRGSLAQTLERRNSRVAGTLLGCVLAAGVLASHLSAWQLILCLTIAQAVAHGFAVRRYLVTAVAATVLGLVQSHMLHGGGSGSTAIDLLERMADTLIGTGIAWAFAYVLPSWERSQIPALVQRTLAAQARHAREALALGQLHAVDNAPELAWRLARREAYDSLSALVQATQRAMAEPRAVQPPVAALERLQARCYQLLAQLTAIKTMLLLRRGRLDAEALQAPLAQTALAVTQWLEGAPDTAPPPVSGPLVPGDAQGWPDPQDGDLGPWLVRRLGLATERAAQVRVAALDAMAPAGAPAPADPPGR